MKNVVQLTYSLLCVIFLSVIFISCEPDDNPVPSGGGGGEQPHGTPKGSGTLSFDYGGFQPGSLSFSGKGYWPPSGTGVAGTIDSAGQRLQILAYKQLTFPTSTQKSAAHFNYLLIDIYDVAGIVPITYNNSNAEVTIQAGLDIDTTKTDSTSYHFTSGSVTIDSKTKTQITGTFTGTATRPSDRTTINIISSSFTINYITGTILSIGENEGGIGGKPPISPFGQFPLPSFQNLNGILGIADVFNNSMGTTTEAKVAFAGFYQSSTNQTSLVSGGDVLLNGNQLDTVHRGQNIIYLLPSPQNPSAELNVAFNGSSTALFNVFGSNTVSPFNLGVTAPSPSTITSPGANASVGRSNNLTIRWTGTSTADSVMLIVSDQGNNVVQKQGLPNNGSFTILSTELHNFLTGSGTIFLAKYRYHTTMSAGDNYAAVAEITSRINVSFY